MKKYYVYRITNTVLNKHYYGVRSTDKDPKIELGTFYFSSSKDKEFIKDQKSNPQNYKYKIVSIPESRQDAVALEIKLHNKFDVGVNESFYNRSKQTSVAWDTTSIPSTAMYGEDNPMFGRKRTDEEKKRISEGTKRGMAQRKDKPWKQVISDEQKKKISETIQGRKWVKNVETGHSCQIDPQHIDEYVSNGYVLGRIYKCTLAPIDVA